MPGGLRLHPQRLADCPPPRHNFYRVPRIRSERPAFELHYPRATPDRPRVPGGSG